MQRKTRLEDLEEFDIITMATKKTGLKEYSMIYIAIRANNPEKGTLFGTVRTNYSSGYEYSGGSDMALDYKMLEDNNWAHYKTLGAKKAIKDIDWGKYMTWLLSFGLFLLLTLPLHSVLPPLFVFPICIAAGYFVSKVDFSTIYDDWKLGIIYHEEAVINHRSLIKVLLNPLLRFFLGICIGSNFDGNKFLGYKIIRSGSRKLKWSFDYEREHDKREKKRWIF